MVRHATSRIRLALFVGLLAASPLVLRAPASKATPGSLRVTVVDESVLAVSGTQWADDLVVRLSADGRYLELDDRSTGDGTDLKLPLEGIDTLRIETGAGDDRILVHDANGSVADRLRLELDGGGGDSVVVGSTGPLSVQEVGHVLADLRLLLGWTDEVERLVDELRVESRDAAWDAVQAARALADRGEAIVLEAETSLLGVARSAADTARVDLLGEADRLRAEAMDDLLAFADERPGVPRDVEGLVAQALEEARQVVDEALALADPGSPVAPLPAAERFARELEPLVEEADRVRTDPVALAGVTERMEAAISSFEARSTTAGDSAARALLERASALEMRFVGELAPALATWSAELERRGEDFALAVETGLMARADAYVAGVERTLVPAAEALVARAETELVGGGAELQGLLEDRLGPDGTALAAELSALLGRMEAIARSAGARLGDRGTGALAKHGTDCTFLTGNVMVGSVLVGTPGNDMLIGTPGTDVILGLGGRDDITGLGGLDFLFGMGDGDDLHGNGGIDLMFGGGGNDCLRGDDGFDLQLGGDGDDFMEGGDDIDLMFGGTGGDEMYGEDGTTVTFTVGVVTVSIHVGNLMVGNAGLDEMHGGDGLDFMFGNADADTMEGGSGIDLMFGNSGPDDMTGGSGQGVTINGVPLPLGNLMFGNSENDIVRGGEHLDLVFGNGENDVLEGGAFLDLLFGNDGNDRATGDGGTDLVFGNAGGDQVFGGDGIDLVFGNSGNDLAAGNDGTDLVFGNGGNDAVFGNGGLDLLFGNAGQDVMFGNDGIDLMFGNRERDVMFGNDGTDIMFGNRGPDVLLGGNGIDVMFGNRDDDVMNGNDGTDLMFGNCGDDRMSGNDGLDIMFGNRGQDTMSGGDGIDLMFGNRADDDMSGDGGIDIMFGNRCNDVMRGGPGLDLMFGNRDDDLMFGEDGTDFMFGNRDRDVMSGGESTDFMFGGRDDDVMTGDAAFDVMFGNRGRDDMSGGAATDLMFGNSDQDTMDGGSGADVMFGNSESDAMSGGPDTDVMFGNGADDWLHGNAGTDVMFGNSGDDDMLGQGGTDVMFGNRGRDRMQGGDATDVIFGNSDADRLFGGAATDVIFGNDGDDKLFGGDGADVLIANSGADAVFGGSGGDFVLGNSGPDVLYGEGDRDFLLGNDDGDLMFGGADRDWMFGNRGGDDMAAGSGDDWMFGNRGDDDMLGESGRDWMFGNRGDDRMGGGPGNDRMFGNRGDDDMWGCSGSDIMLGGLGSDNKDGSGCAPFSFSDVACGEIHGVKFDDRNGNGVRDPGEPGLPGVTIFLDANGNGLLDGGETSVVSMMDDPATHDDESGAYWIGGLLPGTYRVEEVVPAGFTQTSGGHVVTLGPGEVVTGRDFGNAGACRPAADGRSCEQADCSEPGSTCVPKCIVLGRQGVADAEIVECSCQAQDDCHFEITDGSDELRCVGSCPPGTECVLEESFSEDGLLVLCCTCQPVAGCAPAPDGSSCVSTDCPPGVDCRPVRATWDPCTDQVRITDCACPADCYLDVSGPGRPGCVGSCPPGFDCSEIVEDDCDGGVSVSCECVPEACEPEPDGAACAPFPCPDEDQECTPVRIEVDWACAGGTADGDGCGADADCPGGQCLPSVTVKDCECRDPSECHVKFSPVSGPYCEGACPEGEECELMSAGDDYWCECRPAECQPADDGMGCNEADCPQGNRDCVPTVITLADRCVGGILDGLPCGADADCTGGGSCETVALAVECDCLGPNECRVVHEAATGPRCEGTCPPGEECELIEEAGTYRCECAPQACEPLDDASGCRPFDCEDGTQCRPTVVTETDACSGGDFDGMPCEAAADCPGGTCTPSTLVLECDCEPEPVCEPDLEGSRCADVTCPRRGNRARDCLPTLVVVADACVGGVFDGSPCDGDADCPGGSCETSTFFDECDCIEVEQCRLTFAADGTPRCEGACPPGGGGAAGGRERGRGRGPERANPPDQCVLMQDGDELWCECSSGAQACEGVPDSRESEDIQKPIPASGTIGDMDPSALTWPASGPCGSPAAVICDVDVEVRIAHTWIGDVTAWLRSPASTLVELWSNLGSSGDGMWVTLDDEAPANLSGQVIDGSRWRPEQHPSERLCVFDGENAVGTWYLEVNDDSQGDSGRLEFWVLYLSCDPDGGTPGPCP